MTYAQCEKKMEAIDTKVSANLKENRALRRQKKALQDRMEKKKAKF